MIFRGNFHFRGSETALFHLPGSFKECRRGGRPVTGSILLRKAIRNPVLFRFRAYFCSTLKEIFKAVYGQPIATYMKEFRVRQAMKLLRETNDTIADIASQVGYQTQGKFSSAFQSIVKMSPREYRKIQGIAPSDSFSKTL